MERQGKMLLILTFLLVPVLTFGLFPTTPATATHLCQEDTAGPDDEPGQKDLSGLCIDDPAEPPECSLDLFVTWGWDEIAWSGNNTGDACALFDTDNDNFANYSLCVVVGGNLATYQSTRLYSCSDTRVDRCSGATLLADTGDTALSDPISTCSAEVAGADPFDCPHGGDPCPDDTVAECCIDLVDFGDPSLAELLDICSYPSQEPNSDPSDCVVFAPCDILDCDDGISCTVDSCDNDIGRCVNTPEDSLCDNGQFCDGTETCDSGLDCQPGTPVDCSDGVGCTVDSCDESTDSCATISDDSLCDNGQFCDGTETCDPSLDCQPGTPVDCSDGVGCTVDSCDESTDSCATISDDSLCDNGQFCDGTETCDPSLDCQPGTPVDCSDGVGCTVDSCDESTDSCAIISDDSLCDNGQFCDGTETCDPSLDCQPGTPVDCSDGVGCTVDSCDESTDSCATISDDSLCDNGQFCDGTETCDPSLDCQPGTPVDCSDGIACTEDTCDETTDNCGSSPSDANCDDGIFCTDDLCEPENVFADGEGCVITTVDELCDDERVCTDQLCDPADPAAAPSGCVFTFDLTNSDICELEICRTPGFWGTHPNIIQTMLDFSAGGFMVCGARAENVLLNWEGSAVEALCNRPRGDKTLITARTLVSASLNCILTTGNPDCFGTSIEEQWTELDAACTAGDVDTMKRLQSMVDCWNNGGDLSLYDGYGCVSGLCDGIPGQYCGDSGDCDSINEDGPAYCVSFADSCHVQPLVNPDLGFDFQPPGRANSWNCRRSVKTECTFPHTDDCKYPSD